MEYSTLGRSGLRISRLCLGAMTFGAGTGIWGEIAGLDHAQATRLVAMAVERGINLIDTADTYSQGHSEAVVGQALADLGLDESRMLVDQSPAAHGSRPQRRGPRPLAHHAVGGNESSAYRPGSSRPLPVARPRCTRSAGRNASWARRSRDAGKGAAHRRLQLQRGRPGACTVNYRPHTGPASSAIRFTMR